MYIYTYTYMYVYIYICIYIHVYICICICMYTQSHTHNLTTGSEQRKQREGCGSCNHNCCPEWINQQAARMCYAGALVYTCNIIWLLYIYTYQARDYTYVNIWLCGSNNQQVKKTCKCSGYDALWFFVCDCVVCVHVPLYVFKVCIHIYMPRCVYFRHTWYTRVRIHIYTAVRRASKQRERCDQKGLIDVAFVTS